MCHRIVTFWYRLYFRGDAAGKAERSSDLSSTVGGGVIHGGLGGQPERGTSWELRKASRGSGKELSLPQEALALKERDLPEAVVFRKNVFIVSSDSSPWGDELVLPGCVLHLAAAEWPQHTQHTQWRPKLYSVRVCSPSPSVLLIGCCVPAVYHSSQRVLGWNQS